MNFPNFVYRVPGNHQCNGGTYDFKSVHDEDELLEAIQAGWKFSIVDALEDVEYEIGEEDNSPPSRDELEEKARELGLKFDGRTSDRKLLEMVNQSVLDQAPTD